jgi:hypothetical protein
MGHRTNAPRRSTISQADLEAVLWRHRLKFRADYIKDDTPYWRRYILETLAADLSAEEKILNIVLCVHADGDTGENSRPCLDRIQALSGLTRPTIIKYLNSEDGPLAKKGWVLRTAKGSGRSPNAYAVTIPRQTIDELVALYGESSGKGSLPLDASSQAALPLAPHVAVNGFNHYESKKGRSGKNERRSGKAALPDLIDLKNSISAEPSKKSTKRRAGLPPGWEPSEEVAAWSLGEEIGASRAQLAEQANRFRDNALAEGKTFANPDAAFRNWMRRAREWGKLNSSSTAQGPLSGQYRGGRL